jgi:hypothetical protein
MGSAILWMVLGLAAHAGQVASVGSSVTVDSAARVVRFKPGSPAGGPEHGPGATILTSTRESIT